MNGKKRSILISIIFSILSPGLGHMYNGRLKLGVVIYISYMLFGFLLLELGLANDFKGLIFCIFLSLLFYLLIILHSIKLALASADFKFKKYTMPFYYVIWIIIVYLGSIYITDLFAIKAYRVPSPGMEPTLFVGDHIYVDKRVSNKEIKPGNIVVFEYPIEPNLHHVKRCIATEGMEIEIKNKEVFVNKISFNDSNHVQYLSNEILGRNEGHFFFPTFKNNKFGSRDNFGPIKVPDNQMFVLGDNRDRSSDSRVWGFVPIENLIGKAKYIYFSDDRNYKFYELSQYIRFSRLGISLD